MLRKEIAAKSEVGRKAEAVVASGGTSWKATDYAECKVNLLTMCVGLVSDELMLEIVKAELDRLKGKVRHRTLP